MSVARYTHYRVAAGPLRLKGPGGQITNGWIGNRAPYYFARHNAWSRHGALQPG